MNFTCVGLEYHEGAEGLLSDVKLCNNLLVIPCAANLGEKF